MKRILSLFVLFALALMAYGQTDSQWIRYASISPDGGKIVFTYKGDLYLVSSEGGEARQLTTHKAHDYMAVWGNDGEVIAFASDRYGNFDIFTISPEGGTPVRLTYHSADEVPYEFTNDGKQIIFGAQRLDDVNHRQYPTGSQTEVYTVPAEGGKVDQLWTIPGEYIQVSVDGKKMIYHDKPGGENEWRKHHVSSVTRDIWMYDVDSDTHSMITRRPGEDRNPVFTGDQEGMYYLSEESGTFNVHKMHFDTPGKNEQITRFELHPVRFLSRSGDDKLCYTWHGNLYVQPEGEEPQELFVEINAEAKENAYEIVPISGSISEMALSPDGKEVAYIARGEVFVTAMEGAITKRVTNTPAQERFLSFTPDGKGLVYASERNQKWSIYKTVKELEEEPFFYASTILKEEVLVENETDSYQPQISPDGKTIAYIEDKRSLVVMNLENMEKKVLLDEHRLHYMRDGDQYFTWSPDSKWLLVSQAPTLANQDVLLLAADGSKEVNLTESGYGEYRPKWVNGGKQVLWFGNRHGLRSYANSGSRQSDVYTMFFTQDGWDQYNMSKDDYAYWKELQELAKKKKAKEEEAEKGKNKKKDKEEAEQKEEKKVEPLTFDWDGMDKRMARLTIHSSSLGDALLSKDGETLYYLARFEKGYNLWTTNLRTRETKMLVALNGGGGQMVWDKDMKKIVMLSGGRISTIDPKSKKRETVATKAEMLLDPVAERQQMFDHVTHRLLTMFYISDYHGADMDRLIPDYRAKLPSIGNDFEFAELLSELLGENNVSHSGARYRGRMPNSDATASLGIFFDYDYEGKGLKITEVVKGGPLDKDHIDVKAGWIIEEINGQPLDGKVDHAKHLNLLAGKYTALTVYNPDTKKRDHVTVKPISTGQMNGLLRERWVKKNEEEVARLSGGKLGYVHIPGMSDGPYRNAYEKMMGKYHDCEGVIVDTRFNGGGDLVSDLAMFFTGEKFITYETELREVGYEPAFRFTKPTVAMINESNYSDGHCFACGYQELGIGKIIGMPTPGTCSFAGWEGLQNGTITWGSIPLSAKNQKGEWLENNQTVPDVVVKNMPGEIDKGLDKQLEAAVEELLKVVVK